MNTALAILGSLGGVVAFITLVFVTLKAIFRQVNATDKNTKATEKLTEAVGELNKQFVNLDRRVAILEDHDQARRNGARP